MESSDTRGWEVLCAWLLLGGIGLFVWGEEAGLGAAFLALVVNATCASKSAQ